jgi:hypothetical protein
MSAIPTFCLLAIRTVPALVVFGVVSGFSAGAFIGLPAAGIAMLAAGRSKIGTRVGTTLAFVGFAVLVNNPTAGAILGADQNLVGLIVSCGVLFVASTISMATSRILKVEIGFRKTV